MYLNTSMFIRYPQSKLPFNFWAETKALDLTDQEKVLLTYLYTSPHINRLGCFECPVGYISHDLKWSVEIVKSVLYSLQNFRFLVMVYKSDWIYLKDYLMCFPIKTSMQGKHLEKIFRTVPETCIFYSSLLQNIFSLSHLPASFRHLLRTYRHRLLEKERNEKKKTRKKK